jgi:MFS family permease
MKRYSIFFSSVNMAGAFGGLLASAIGNMDGIGGYRAWRWVFILGMTSGLYKPCFLKDMSDFRGPCDLHRLWHFVLCDFRFS